MKPGLDGGVQYFYLKLPEMLKTGEPPRLAPILSSCMPCFLDKPSTVSCTNVDGASRGLPVYFVGPYAEKDEITFSDVCFVIRKNKRTKENPFESKKKQLPDGQWMYCHYDPGLRIPLWVDERRSPSKQLEEIYERSITVRFVPHGSPRKILDITVVLVPDRNPEGQYGWNVWKKWGFKETLIKQLNRIWDGSRASGTPEVFLPILWEGAFDETRRICPPKTAKTV